jgi:hypothetical protein
LRKPKLASASVGQKSSDGEMVSDRAIKERKGWENIKKKGKRQ